MVRNRNLTLRLLAAVLVLGCASQTRADGWINNPFGSSGSKNTTVTTQEPSTLQKMNQGAKNFFAKLNPFRSSKSRGDLSQPKSRKTGWNWWASEPEEDSSEDLKGFMSQERPDFSGDRPQPFGDRPKF